MGYNQKKHRWLITELMDGSLNLLVSKPDYQRCVTFLFRRACIAACGGNSELYRRIIMFKLCMGLYELHQQGIVHRDLKPQNILFRIEEKDTLGNDGHDNCAVPISIKLADFGLARGFSSSSLSRENGGEEEELVSTSTSTAAKKKNDDDDGDISTTYVVTRWYRAPELLAVSIAAKRYDDAVVKIRNKDEPTAIRYTFQSDVWSLGCIFYELYCCRHMFAGKNTEHQETLINGFFKNPESFWRNSFTYNESVCHKNRVETIPSDVQDVIKLMLAENPSDRPSMETIIRLPMFARFLPVEFFFLSIVSY